MNEFDDVLNKIDKEQQQLQEMARIGNVGNFQISVFSDEENIPHFHFFNIQTKAKGCIKVLTCEYFKHGKYTSELNSKERKVFQNFLSNATDDEIYKEGTTNFKVICHKWNKNNPENKIDINTKQPDSKQLK